MTRSAALFACIVSLSLAAGVSIADETRPHIRAEVTYETKDQLQALLATDVDITHAHGSEFDVLATPEQLSRLRSLGLTVRVVDENVYGSDGLRGGGWLSAYMSYPEAAAALSALASAYPALTELTSIGQSHEGNDIWALKVSDNASTDENEPEVLINGNHHAREVITPIICVAMAESLLTNYGTDPQYTEWVDEREIWFVPVVNPDGLLWVESNDLFWRKNRWVDPGSGTTYGVDLNRNYPYEWGHDNNGSDASKSGTTYRGPSAGSEPETQVMMAFIDSREFKYVLSFHAYGNLTLWGPGYKPALPVDQDVFAGYGSLIQSLNGYSPGNAGMGNIYIANGVTGDWVYNTGGHPKAYHFTPEVGTFSDYFNPPASRIPTLTVEGSILGWTAIEYAARPEQLAPPGQPVFNMVPTPRDLGDYTVAWSPPFTADTEVVFYELTEKQGGGDVTDDAESGSGNWDLGGWSVSGARSSSGSSSFYSGSGDDLNRIMMAKEAYRVQPGDSFTFQAWYDIESNWDYAYAILSTDGGRSFVTLPGTGTTMSDPNGNNANNGITGSSGGWQLHTYDLSAWSGIEVHLGLRYWTDGGVVDEGFYADDIHPVQTWTTKTVLSSSIVGTTYEVTGRPLGSYWYSVRGQDAEGDWGYPSENLPVVVDDATDVADLGARNAFSLATHPNPSRGTTSIRFSLPAPGDHSLVVYDVAGRRVRSLSSGRIEAGPREVGWDGRNQEGRPVPSGVYFYRLSADAGELRERAVIRR
jgi:hypothetical protein